MLWTTFFAFKESSIVVHIPKLSNKTSYSTLRTHQKTCTQVPHPWCRSSPWENASNTIHVFWGAHILTWPQENHAKLCASLITFYLMCMDVQTDAMKPHQPYPWRIGSIQSAIDNAIPTLLTFISTTLTCISLNHISPFITNYLIGSIHFSSILKENLDHLLMPIACWCKQRSETILRNPTWWANANTQKKTISKQCWTMSFYCPFILQLRKCKHSIDCGKA